jgi:hypothetical protein
LVEKASRVFLASYFRLEKLYRFWQLAIGKEQHQKHRAQQ